MVGADGDEAVAEFLGWDQVGGDGGEVEEGTSDGRVWGGDDGTFRDLVRYNGT